MVTISRTDSLKKFITRELKTICPDVCYQQANDTTPFPYIVYDLSHRRNEAGYNYFFEINIWDQGVSTKQIEALADSLEDLLDDTVFGEKTFTVSIDLNTRNTVEDSDKNLKRRRILFDLSYFD
jgi:hypothetical protein